MKIEDEIQQATDLLISSEMRELSKEQLKAAMSRAGMRDSSPKLYPTPPELLPTIRETLPYMQFDCNNIIFTTPNGRTYVRKCKSGETPNIHSFEAFLFRDNEPTDCQSEYKIWVFPNGSICFVRRSLLGNRDYYTYNYPQYFFENSAVAAERVRERIIATIAEQSLRRERENEDKKSSKSHKKSSEGCYIATAVYGSYDSPQVRVLRKYRDDVLKQTVFGRLFIKIYYALSPTLVKYFGNKKWFRIPWKHFLDKKVAKLMKTKHGDKK